VVDVVVARAGVPQLPAGDDRMLVPAQVVHRPGHVDRFVVSLLGGFHPVLLL
jgi:hypothetical protein